MLKNFTTLTKPVQKQRQILSDSFVKE